METTKKINGKQPLKKSTKINLIGCDTIVNSPSYTYYSNNFHIHKQSVDSSDSSSKFPKNPNHHPTTSTRYNCQNYIRMNTSEHFSTQVRRYFKKEVLTALPEKGFSLSIVPIFS